MRLSRDWPYVYKKTSTERELKVIRSKIKCQEELCHRVISIILSKAGQRKIGWQILCRSLGEQLGEKGTMQKYDFGKRHGFSLYLHTLHSNGLRHVFYSPAGIPPKTVWNTIERQMNNRKGQKGRR